MFSKLRGLFCKKDDPLKGIKLTPICHYANGQHSHAEGHMTRADGENSHAEGLHTSAKGYCAHAEGYNTDAYSFYSHAEGCGTQAKDWYTHAEGAYTIADGCTSHAEGRWSHARGHYSHAEGHETHADGDASHTEGFGTIAKNKAEHAEGAFNISHQGKTIHSVGIGKSPSDLKNALEMLRNGDLYLIGVGGFDGVKIEDAKTIQSVINNLIEQNESLSKRCGRLEDIVSKLIQKSNN